MISSILYNSLFNLYEKVASELKIAKDKSLLTKIPYEKINAISVDYEHEVFYSDWENIEYYDFYIWASDNFNDFKNEIELLDEYKIAANSICKQFDIPQERRKYAEKIGVFGFVKLLMNEVPNGRINKENISEYIETFISDYQTYKTDNKFTWQIQIWLGNIDFEGDKIHLSDKVTLRKPIIEELHIIRQRSHHIDDLSKMAGRSLPSTCILEFSMKAATQPVGLYHDDIRHEIENWLDALRLFKVGNITAIYKSVMPLSVLEHGATESPESPFDTSWKDKIDYSHTSNYKYLINKEEANQLFAFSEKLKPFLKDISQKSYLTGSYLDLAFHRYKDSLLRSEVNVNRMVSAITCLEALLSNSSSEITYKISIHVAGLLKHFGFNSVKVFEKMKTAYSIRSTLLHGSKLDNKLTDFSKNYTHEIVNYARICLLVALQLKGTMNKDNLIKKIDHSLLDKTEYDELNKIISDNVLIPIVYPYRTIFNGDEIALN